MTQGYQLLSCLFNIVLAMEIRGKKTKMKRNWKRSKTVQVCRGCDPVHRSPEDTARKPQELINESGKFSGYKTNTQKSCTFVHKECKMKKRKKQSYLPSQLKEKKPDTSPQLPSYSGEKLKGFSLGC